MDLIKGKINQTIDILKELDLDCWLIFCRESDMMADPALPLVVGHNVVWQSAFFITRKGATIALVGNYDAPDYERSGRYDRVIPYIQDCGKELLKQIKKINPRKIAINYSIDNTAADGLSHGMYLLLKEYLKGTIYARRLASSEKLLALLRGRKTGDEIALISKAARLSVTCWDELMTVVHTGMTEKEIASKLKEIIFSHGAALAFEPLVNAGAKTPAGHGNPTDAVLEQGDLLHIDFGARCDGYCSDIQRLAYFRRPGEDTAPPPLTAAFDKVKEVIDKTSREYRPGARGYRIDALARKILNEGGYPEYQHALGHQIGRSTHDGASIVGPKWKRYGSTPLIPLEADNVFTVELGIDRDGIGYVGLEEDLKVTSAGGEFLCPRQTELVVK